MRSLGSEALFEKAASLGVGCEDLQPCCVYVGNMCSANFLFLLPAVIPSLRVKILTLWNHKPNKNPFFKLLLGMVFYHNHKKGTNAEVQYICLLFTKEEIERLREVKYFAQGLKVVIKVTVLVRYFLSDSIFSLLVPVSFTKSPFPVPVAAVFHSTTHFGKMPHVTAEILFRCFWCWTLWWLDVSYYHAIFYSPICMKCMCYLRSNLAWVIILVKILYK